MSFLSAALFSESDILKSVEVSFLDIGARGDLPPPWKQLESRFPERLRVGGFETDSEELASLRARFPSRHYFPMD